MGEDFDIGDRVKVIDIGSLFYDHRGKIVAINEHNMATRVWVKLDLSGKIEEFNAGQLRKVIII